MTHNEDVEATEDNEVTQTAPLSFCGVDQAHGEIEDAAQHALSPERPISTHSEGRQGIDVDQIDDSTLHHVSARHGRSRVAKSKRRSRRTTAPIVVHNGVTTDGLSEISDYMEIVLHKAKERDLQYSILLERLQDELQLAIDDREAMQTEVISIRQEKEDQSGLLKDQKGKMVMYETKLKRFKIFMDGLGNDMSALQKGTIDSDRKRKALVKEGEVLRVEREALSQEINKHYEEALKTRSDAGALCTGLSKELNEQITRGNYLEQELKEKVGMLAEERDSRARLENQLKETKALHELRIGTEKATEQRMEEMLRDSSKALCDKLTDLCEAIEGDPNQASVASLTAEMSTAIGSLSAQAGTTVNDLSTVKDLISKLNER